MEDRDLPHYSVLFPRLGDHETKDVVSQILCEGLSLWLNITIGKNEKVVESFLLFINCPL